MSKSSQIIRQMTMKFSFDQMNSCQACAILNGISGLTIMAASSLIFKIRIQIQMKIQRQIQLQTNSQLPRLRHPERDQRSDYNGSSTTYIFGLVSTFGEDDGHSHQSGLLSIVVICSCLTEGPSAIHLMEVTQEDNDCFREMPISSDLRFWPP